MQQIHREDKAWVTLQEQKHWPSSYSAKQTLLEPKHIEKMQDSKKLYLPEQSSEPPHKELKKSKYWSYS